MTANCIAKQKVEKLIDVMLTDGVQPSDLVDNIFFEHYKSICYRHVQGQVIGELVYHEEDSLSKTTVTLRYYYGLGREIERIEEICDGNILILWDRTHTEKELLEDIIEELQRNCKPQQVEEFISSLPENLKNKIREFQMHNVA